MMKKLMVLCVVLALAGAVQAGMYYDCDQDTFAAGDVLTISVLADGGTGNFAIGALTVDYGAVPAAGNLAAGMQYGMKNAGTVRDGSVHNIVITDIVGSKDTGQADVAAGMVLYSFQIDTTGVTADAITIDDWAGANPFGIPFPVSTNWNGGTVDMEALVIPTPEPMTIALLGLGGLFLRRKK